MIRFYLLIGLILGGFTGSGQSFIAKEEAFADIDSLIVILREVHFDPFLFVDEKEYLANVEEIKNALSDSVKTEDFILSLYRLTAPLEDSHTGPGIQQMVLGDALRKKHIFPYRIVLKGNQAFIPVQERKDIPAGAEIISINDRPVSSFVSEFKTYYGGRAEYKSEMAERLFGYFLLLSGERAPFTIRFNDPSGKTGETRTEEGINFIQTIGLNMPGVLYGNGFEIADNLGIIRFQNMYGSHEEWITLLDSAFTTFQENGIRSVAIDLRENSGGNSLLGEVLFGYITDRPFLMQSKRQWKVSQRYKNYLLENGNSNHEYLLQENGTIWTRSTSNPQPSRLLVDDRFTGKVYMLTGPFTFSSGNMVADAAKTYDLAVLAGRPTGENTVDFGEVLSVTLPHSGVVVNISTAMDHGANCVQSDYSPVIPDIRVEPSLEDALKGTDSTMEFLKNKVALE